ncbi:MAG: TonB-dependent receptor, partial [Nitrospinota bacterium]|nr:TonB-dependent receptor [Nitrospinota bacterium]
PVKIEVTQERPTASKKLYLAPARQFEEIVVTAERNPDQVGKITASGAEMRQMPGSMGDPIRAISNLPGMATGAGFFSAPAIRGSSPEQNVFYVDGIETNNLFHIGLSSIFHADMVKDFNLYLSSPGPEFKEALGGVIDVRLRDPKSDRFSYKASISLLEASFLMEGPLAEGHSLVVTGRRSYIDLIVGPFIKDMAATNGVKVIQFPWYYDYMAKYVWNINPRHKFSLLLHGTQDKTMIEMTEDAPIAKQEPVLVGNFEFDMLSHVQGATLASSITDRVKNTLVVSRRVYSQKASIAQALNGDNVFAQYDARDQVEIKATDNNTFTIGGEEGRSDIHLYFEGKAWAPNEFEPQRDITSAETKKLETVIRGSGRAAFVKDRWRLFEPLTLVAGARWIYEDYLKDSYTLPRASLEIKPSADLLLTAGWGQYAQFPPGSFVVDVFGNPNLNFEKSVHNTVGVKKRLWDGAWDVGVEAYYKTFSDLVVPEKEKNYVNGGSGNAYGFETLIRKNQSSDSITYGWLAVTYSHSTRKNDLTGESFNFSHDQPLIINAVAAWRLPIWTLSGRWHFSSGRPFTPVVDTITEETGRIRPVYGALGAERLPDTHQLDVRIDRIVRYNEWKMALFFEVQNIYWSKNISGYTYNEDFSKREPVEGMPPLVAFGLESTF